MVDPSPQEITPEILSDDPSADDRFGSHTPVAGGLIKLIKTQVGGKIVALDGAWGSGKSTVIRLVHDKLSTEEDNDYRVVLFDAWVHRGDPFRYAFLERLIKSISTKTKNKAPWIDGTEAKVPLDEIRTVHEERDIDKTPNLHWPAAVILISLLSWPLASHLYDLVFLLPSDWFATVQPLANTAALAIYMIPIIVVVGLYLYTRPWFKKALFSREWWTTLDLGEQEKHPKSFLSLFIGGVLHWKWSASNKQIEPTSLEFQKVIADLLNKAFAGKKRRLVIVFDNLDRVDVATAGYAWDALQSISELLRTDLIIHKEKVWIIIPIDQERTGQFVDLDMNKDKAADVQAEFLKKIFNLTFQVPAQLLSKWAGYFDSQTSIALKGLSVERISTLRIIFAAYFRNRNITPRLIKRFINDVASSYLVWGNTPPLEVQALALALSQNGTSIDDIIKNPNKVAAQVSSLLDAKTLQRDLAAIKFGVNPDQAIEVLIEKDFMLALEQTNAEVLKQYFDLPGFETAVTSIARDNQAEWTKGTPLRLAQLGAVLSDLPGPLSAQIGQKLRLVLRGLLQGDHKWQVLTVRIVSGWLYVFDLDTSPAERQEFLRKTFATELGQAETLPNPNDRAMSIIRVCDYLSKKGELASGIVQVPGPADSYLQQISALALLDVSRYRQHLKPQMPAPQVIEVLNTQAGQGGLATTKGQCLLPLLEAIGNSLQAFDTLVQSVMSRIQRQQGISADEVTALIESLLYLYRGGHGNAGNYLRNFFPQGNIYAQIATSTGKKDKAIAVSLLSEMLLFPGGHSINAGQPVMNGYNELQNVRANPSSRPEILLELADYVTVTSTANEFFNAAKQQSKPLLVGAMTNILLSKGTINLDINNCFPAAIDIWSAWTPGDREAVISYLLPQKQLVQSIILAPAWTSALLLLLRACGNESYDETDTKIGQTIANQFAKLKESEWGPLLVPGSNAIDLLVAVRKRLINGWLGEEFRAALEKNIIGLASKNITTSEIDYVDICLGVLETSSERVLLDNLRDAAIREANPTTIKALRLTEKRFVKSGCAEEKIDEITRSVLINGVTTDVSEIIAWIREFYHGNAELFGRAKRTSRDALEAKLGDRSGGAEGGKT